MVGGKPAPALTRRKVPENFLGSIDGRHLRREGDGAAALGHMVGTGGDVRDGDNGDGLRGAGGADAGTGRQAKVLRTSAPVCRGENIENAGRNAREVGKRVVVEVVGGVQRGGFTAAGPSDENLRTVEELLGGGSQHRRSGLAHGDDGGSVKELNGRRVGSSLSAM